MKNSLRRDEKLLEAARGYLMLDMFEQALRELRAISDPAPLSFDYHQLRGEALRQKQDFFEAIDAFNLALVEKPDDLAVLIGIAWCYKRTNQLSRAIVAMEQAYKSEPDEAIVLYNLACYHALAKNKEQALSWLGRALRKEGNLRRLIPSESDFDSLRRDADFQFIVKNLDEVAGVLPD